MAQYDVVVEDTLLVIRLHGLQYSEGNGIPLRRIGKLLPDAEGQPVQ